MLAQKKVVSAVDTAEIFVDHASLPIAYHELKATKTPTDLVDSPLVFAY